MRIVHLQIASGLNPDFIGGGQWQRVLIRQSIAHRDVTIHDLGHDLDAWRGGFDIARASSNQDTAQATMPTIIGSRNIVDENDRVSSCACQSPRRSHDLLSRTQYNAQIIAGVGRAASAIEVNEGWCCRFRAARGLSASPAIYHRNIRVSHTLAKLWRRCVEFLATKPARVRE